MQPMLRSPTQRMCELGTLADQKTGLFLSIAFLRHRVLLYTVTQKGDPYVKLFVQIDLLHVTKYFCTFQ